ncbi:MAG: heavy metal translocating P-type ATPase [Myxococcota bacterium]
MLLAPAAARMATSVPERGAFAPRAQMLREAGRAGASGASEACLHCGQPLPADGTDGFCCGGCRAVHGLLQREGLERYYALRGDRGLPVGDVHLERRDRKWLEPLEGRLAASEGGSCRVDLDVQGIHCSACVWLVEELFQREPGGLRIVVNPAVGTAELAVERAFPLRRFVETVERFGYLLGPAIKGGARKRTDDLLVRTGICVALAMNGMMFAAAIHLGLREGPVYALLSQLGWAAALLSVLVGGPVFFRSAWHGLRRGVLHLDLPIALGIALAFGGSTWSFLFGGGRAAYVDSVAAFIALMLLGRWLQERMLAKNRDRLLASDGAEGLLARRVRDGRVELVPCGELAVGDRLLVAPGDLVPVDATLEGGPASCSLDWINGESEPRELPAGATVPAGAFNAGSTAIRVRARQPFERSLVTELLRRPAPERLDGPRATPWWRRVSTAYVVGVLLAAAGGLVGWLAATGDVGRSLEVTTAVLVVTCPCAFGIATPLAYEMVQARLRRRGLFVRSSTLLDRLREVHRVVLDKTGTLTDGVPHLAEPAVLEGLTGPERKALYDLAARSAHPKSLAVKRALERMAEEDGAPLAIDPAAEVTEHAGRGLELRRGGRRHRLGAPGWAGEADADAAAGEDLVYAVDGTVRARLETRERIRPDAEAEIARLRQAGYDVWILSGDSPQRARQMAAALGLPEERGVGGCDPDAKAAWLRAHEPERTLFVGDGINDGPAADAASCSGTPAVDRPFMAARCDFYFVTPGLSPIAQALRGSFDLTQAVRRNLILAVAYNAAALAVAWAGWMQPWLAAVVMPASSLASLAVTAVGLSERKEAPWKS